MESEKTAVPTNRVASPAEHLISKMVDLRLAVADIDDLVGQILPLNAKSAEAIHGVTKDTESLPLTERVHRILNETLNRAGEVRENLRAFLK